MSEAHHFQLARVSDETDAARIIEFDDFQVIFDFYNRQIRINLSGE